MKEYDAEILAAEMSEVMEQRRIIRREQGIDNPNSKISDKEKLVNAINLLICHTKQDDIIDTAVGLKMVIERLDLEDVCHIWIDTGAKYKLRLYFTGKEEEGIA